MPEGEKIPEATRLKTPEARERYLRDVYEKSKGTEAGSDIVFFHGTSVEVLEHAIEKGTLPGQSREGALHGSGSLFVYPVPDRIPTKKHPSAWLERAIPRGEEADADSADGYARINAETQYILSQLGYSFEDFRTTVAVRHLLRGGTPEDVDDPEIGGTVRGLLEAHGEAIIYTLLNQARQRKGVVLGLKRSAFKNLHATDGLGLGDPGEGDMKLLTGSKGLGLEHIGHIRVLGEDGKRFFESLAETR